MQLEDYFEFEKCDTQFGEIDRIRFKGRRIALEHVLEPYLQGESAERIYYNYRHALTLEQVYAAITFYLNRKTEIDSYLERGRDLEDKLYQEYLKKEPDEIGKRLRALAAARTSSQT
ncbi:MAG TPA: DUF433 domain-containing protein [Gemmataceae bacterium]|nr:DUF433 domain-containing protein [Gemmataceae bacterium]